MAEFGIIEMDRDECRRQMAEALDDEAEGLSLRCSAVNAEAEALRCEIETRQTEVNRMQLRLEYLRGECRRLQERIAELRVEAAVLRDTLEEAEAETYAESSRFFQIARWVDLDPSRRPLYFNRLMVSERGK